MKTYTELSNVNSLDDVDCVDSDETSWKLISAKILYKSGIMSHMFSTSSPYFINMVLYFIALESLPFRPFLFHFTISICNFVFSVSLYQYL